MIRRLHLITGLVLFSYLLSHLINHALVIISVGMADRWLETLYPVLTSLPVTALLIDAMLIHVALALLALWRRRTLRFTPYEVAQYLLGFALPLLLAPHVLHTRVADSLYGADWGYYRNILLGIWVIDPWQSLTQGLLLLTAWLHAVIGLRFWLRLKPWYPVALPWLRAAALLLPALALAGMIAGGNEIALRAATDPGFIGRARASAPRPAAAAMLEGFADRSRLVLLGLVATVLVARLGRHLLRRHRGLVAVRYTTGRQVAVPRGFSVLEASWLAGVPHAAVCGGRGRCSTCRVRVRAVGGGAVRPLPGAEEARVLARIGAPPDIRLACQLRPEAPVLVTPLLDAALSPGALMRFRNPRLLGTERDIVIAFADLRDFTRLSEHRLPYDVVHLLNAYFRCMGDAVATAGGRVDKFIGDGVMALFGTGEARGPTALRDACCEGLEAARLMALALQDLNRTAAAEFGAPLRIGIGLHAGPAILGEMGHGRVMSLTAIGDAVNTASRLEGACKEFGCELVVSEAVLAAAGALHLGEPRTLQVRGRVAPLPVRAVARAAELPPFGRRR